MLVRDIVSRVRAAIDELMENDSSFIRVSQDELNLTRIIVDKIGYALQQVIEEAPLDKLGSDAFATFTPQELASNFTITALDASSLVAKVKLPTDLLRIVEARLSSWSHFPLPESDTSQVYLMQQDKYARGSWDRPVNILTYQGADRYLEMYCAKETTDTLNFTFIRKPDTSAIGNYDPTDPTDSAAVNVPSKLEASLIYQIAGMTKLAFNENMAASLLAISQRYLDPQPNNTQSE